MASALARIGRALISELDRPALLDRFCRLAVEELGCDESHTYLRDPESGDYVPVATFGSTAEEWEAIRVVRIPGAQVERYAGALHDRDLVQLDVWRPAAGANAARLGSPRVLAMALRRGGELVGVHVARYRNHPRALHPGGGAHRAGHRPTGVPRARERASGRGTRSRQPGEGRLRREHVARAADAAQRDHWLQRSAGRSDVRGARSRSTGDRAADRRAGPGAARAGQHDARHEPAGIRHRVRWRCRKSTW